MIGERDLPLSNAPIVEAVVDIDCDLPVGFDLTAVESTAKEMFADSYPKARRKILQHHQIKASVEAPAEFSVQTGVDALQFHHEDERQLIQIRTRGFSFNRLAPYASLDEYLPEVERRWRQFVELASPVQIRRIALRFINRLLLPTVDGIVELNDYLRLGPRLVDEHSLQLIGFLHQQSAVEPATGHMANTTMVMQLLEGENLPVLFDIEVMHLAPSEPQQWENIRATILSLRRLKNSIFWNTLTDECLNQFR